MRARDITLCDLSVGMVLCMDVAHRCAWLATPDGSQRQRTNISIRQVRGLVKAGLITTRADQNTPYTTFVISAKGQAEVRKLRHREGQSLGKSSTLIDAGTKEDLPKETAMRRSSEAVDAPRSG